MTRRDTRKWQILIKSGTQIHGIGASTLCYFKAKVSLEFKIVVLKRQSHVPTFYSSAILGLLVVWKGVGIGEFESKL